MTESLFHSSERQTTHMTDL